MNFSFSIELPKFLASSGIEGVVLHPYLDSVKVPTIGIGTTVYPDGRKVTMKDPNITLEQAYEFCLDHLNKIVLPVLNNLITVDLTQTQIDMLGSLVYNIGTGAFTKSTLLKNINAEADIDTVKTSWLAWNKGGGKVISGLVNRRSAEFKHYIS